MLHVGAWCVILVRYFPMLVQDVDNYLGLWITFQAVDNYVGCIATRIASHTSLPI